MKYLIMVIVMFAAVNQLSAQTIINDSPTKNRVYLITGIEPTTMITFGYQRNFSVGFLNRNITSYAEWGTSLHAFSFSNSEFKIGGILPLFGKGSFKVVNNLNHSVGSVTTKKLQLKEICGRR